MAWRINLTGYQQVLTVDEMTSLDLAWSCFTLLLLGLCMLACVEQPKGPGYLNAQGEVRQSSVLGTVVAVLKRLFA